MPSQPSGCVYELTPRAHQRGPPLAKHAVVYSCPQPQPHRPAGDNVEHHTQAVHCSLPSLRHCCRETASLHDSLGGSCCGRLRSSWNTVLQRPDLRLKMTTMTVPPPSPTHGRRLHQGHAGPFDKPLATRSLRNNNNDIFEDAQRMHSWRDRFLELCGLHGRDTERDGSSLLNILHTKLYLDKWEATFLGPSIGLEQLRKVLLYIEKILATSEAHRTGKKCVYSLDYCAFQDLRILRRLQRESPALESQHLHQIRLSCSECAPLQPRLLFDDFPSNATHHEHLTLPAWQPPDEQLLDDANDIFCSTISRHSMCKLPDDHTRHHVGRLQLLDAVDPVADPQNREIVYQTVFHGSAHEASDQVTSLMRLKFHVSR